MFRLMAIACCVIGLACVGCGESGPPLGQVSGTVTMDGEPLANALVTFTPEAGGRGSMGKTDGNGKYELAFVDSKGALIGNHKVSVTTVQESSGSATEMSSDSPEYANQGGPADYENATTKEAIPEKYNTKTELTFDVKAGSNTYDIPLESGS